MPNNTNMNNRSSGRSGGRSLYQQAYHFLAANRGGAKGRAKTMNTIRKTGSPAFVAACEQVARNNPHWFRDKSDPMYETLRQRSFNRKGRGTRSS